MNVGWLHHFQEFVRSIILQSFDGGGSVEEGDALVLAMGNDGIEAETFGLGIHKVIPVAKEDLPLDAPMVVDEIGVIEVHAPAFPLWRKTAEEKHFGILRQEGNERMIFHFCRAAFDVCSVQISHVCTFSKQR